MLKAVIFDEFSYRCQYFNSSIDVNNGYGCDNPLQEEKVDINGKEYGCCYCYSCPLGIVAEQQDLSDKNNIDAVNEDIDWDGLTQDDEIGEDEYLLVKQDDDASEDEKEALYNYELHMHRYDKKWLDNHGIENGICG